MHAKEGFRPSISSVLTDEVQILRHLPDDAALVVLVLSLVILARRRGASSVRASFR